MGAAKGGGGCQSGCLGQRESRCSGCCLHPRAAAEATADLPAKTSAMGAAKAATPDVSAKASMMGVAKLEVAHHPPAEASVRAAAKATVYIPAKASIMGAANACRGQREAHQGQCEIMPPPKTPQSSTPRPARCVQPKQRWHPIPLKRPAREPPSRPSLRSFPHRPVRWVRPRQRGLPVCPPRPA